MKALSALGISVLAWLTVMAVPASATAIVATPTSVTAAGVVTLSGDVLVNGKAACGVPGTVTLISPAFAGLGEFAGVGAVFVRADATGHYSASVTLRASVPAGTYTITARCGGGNLGVSATLVVSGLPRTGGSIGPLSDAAAAGLGGMFVVTGSVALLASRRRRASIRA